MKITKSWVATVGLFFLLPLSTPAAGLPSGTELLERSINYHDPEGAWSRSALALSFDESRPDGSARRAEVAIDLRNQVFSWASQREGHSVAGRLEAQDCEVSLDGKQDISAEDIETYGLSCKRIIRMRNYYTYLWGLPMKLRDPGTQIDDTVTMTNFDGKEVLALRVTYEQEVGGDTWYFYFDPETAALTGYRFFHDETKNDGEYITLDGEVLLGGLRLPKTRAWYYNKDDGYLGTDTLVGERSRAN